MSLTEPSISGRKELGRLKLSRLYPNLSELSLSPEPPLYPLSPYTSHESLIGISPLSQYQNIEYKKLSFDFHPSDKHKKLPTLYTTPEIKDFSQILSQIDQVISPKSKSQFYFILREDEPITQQQPEKLAYFYKIYIKLKKPPLSINIKKIIGRPAVYISFTEQHPRPTNYEKVYYKDFFEISDQAFEFKSDYVYLGVFCETECRYKIEISFGKYASLTELRKLKQANKVFPDEEKERIRAGMKKGKICEKNFVEANKDLKGFIETFRMKEGVGSGNGDDWICKRKEILMKKKLIMQAKKLKAIEGLNRQAKRIEKEQMYREECEKKQALQKFQKILCVLMYIISSSSAIKSKIKSKRSKIFKRISINLKASKIQNYIRSKLKVPISKLSLLIASTSLKFFKNSISSQFQSESSKIVIKTIIRKATANLLVHQIGNFGLKILKIQRYFRAYLLKKKLRMKRLNVIWKTSVDKLLYKIKDKKTKKNKSLKYSIIPATAKNRALNDYYLGCVSSFYINLRNFKNMIPDNSTFTTTIEMPIFQYIPEDSLMQSIVQKLLKKKTVI